MLEHNAIPSLDTKGYYLCLEIPALISALTQKSVKKLQPKASIPSSLKSEFSHIILAWDISVRMGTGSSVAGRVVHILLWAGAAQQSAPQQQQGRGTPADVHGGPQLALLCVGDQGVVEVPDDTIG